jgi:group I intron endonuclease
MSTRADLKRAYKERKPEAGIYQIRNLVNGKVLLGSSVSLDGRLNRHRFALRIGQHRFPALQADWNQHGEAAFAFEIAEVVKPSDDPDFSLELALEELEQRWVQTVQPFGERGYNPGPKIRNV